MRTTTMPKRTIEQIIEMGQDAIGDQIVMLVAHGQRLDSFEGKLLCDYVKAALGVRKDAREQSLLKGLGDVNDADLMKMIAADLGVDVGRLQDFIAEAKAAKAAQGQRAS